MVSKQLISVVVPVFNERASIAPFLERFLAVVRTNEALAPFAFEFVFVNDGSTDGTLDALVAAAAGDPSVTVVDLSRNFGKEAALTAGLDMAKGAAVVPIDVDLQDPPELVAEMVRAWQEGAEVVVARRASRLDDTSLKRVTARLFYRIHNAISDIKLPVDVGDFRLMDRRVVDALKALPENRRFMKGLFAWIGFRTVAIPYHRAPRAAGASKFSGWSLWNLALEGITSFGTAPLRIWTYLGFVVAALALVMTLVIVSQRLFFGLAIPGYATLASAVFFLSGVQLVGIGIIGEYLGRVYSEAKSRPIYVVRQTYRKEPVGTQ